MWPHRRSRSSSFRAWWGASRSSMWQMFDKTCDQMNHWRWENPHAFGDQVNRSDPQTTSSGKVECTGERFSWYGSDDPRAKIELPCCRQYKPGDFLAVRPLKWDEIIKKDDDDENWAIPERRAVEGAVLTMAMTMMMARVRRTPRAVRKGLGKGRDQRMGQGKGR